MTTSQSLYTAVIQDDMNMLTPGSISDYGFMSVSDENHPRLFGAYQSLAKFLGKNKFIKTMHESYLNEQVHETVDELSKTIPEPFQAHWINFINNGGKIKPFYI